VEVATLTATLEAQVTKFLANMKAADAALDSAQKQLDSTDASAVALSKSLDDVKMSNSNLAAGIQVLKDLQDNLRSVNVTAVDTHQALQDVTLTPVQAAETAAVSRSEIDSLNDIGNAAVKNAAKVQTMSAAMSAWTTGAVRGKSGRFLSNAEISQIAMTRMLSGSGDFQVPLGYDFGGKVTPLRRRKMMNDLAAATILASSRDGGSSGPSMWDRMISGYTDYKALMSTLGWRGEGSHWTRLGFGGGGGRRGFRIGWGWGIPMPPHARFGTPLAMSGFGAERVLASMLGISGSMLGGLFGGGALLGAGALGTMAVGAGTNLAGVGQAAGDISTVSKDLGALQTAIQQYGRKSVEAANAQLQLNTDLKGFSPIAKQAVLAAAQTSQGFKALFDKLTGGAEKTGAEIINQAMKTGEKFLPTIGKFAAQNMHILQKHLQPAFKWLSNPSFQGPGRGGGLGMFTNLEQIFQKHFPTAIHAGEQGFELFIKTVDLAAQHLGHFISALNSFFTRMNHQDFGKWTKGVETLISMFHSWVGMFGSLGKVVFGFFHATVGLGTAFAKLMDRIFTQISKYLNQSGTQNLLTQLFSAHLQQLISDIGGLIIELLPLVEKTASAWIRMEIVAVTALNEVIGSLKTLVGWMKKIPFGDQISKYMGYALAAGIFLRVNRLLVSSLLAYTKAIPIIGRVFVMIGSLGKALLGIGPAAETGAVEADAALTSVGDAGTTAGAKVAAGFTAMLGPIAIAIAAVYVLDKGIKALTGVDFLSKAWGSAGYGADKLQDAIRKKGSMNPYPMGTSDYFEWIAGHRGVGKGVHTLGGDKGYVDPRNAAYIRGEKDRHHVSAAERRHRQAMTRLFKSLGIPVKMVNGVPQPNIDDVHSPGNPTGYLDKQQAETDRARMLIAQGNDTAAKKLLELEKQQLDAMLKTAKTQAERTAILGQLSTITSMMSSSAKNKLGGAGINSWSLPIAMQEAIARADALAALNPNLQGPTSLQYKMALKAKAAAMKAIDSHTLTMQQLIDAWNVVSQANSTIAQRLGVFANTYHTVSTAAIIGAVKGLTAAQKMQLRERLAQRDAHRGYAPNQSAVGGAGSTVASPHHRQHHRAGGGGRLPASDSGGGTIHIDTVEIHGVQNVRQLAAEIKKLGRQTYQRSGGRR
jgi:hypothetical protein